MEWENCEGTLSMRQKYTLDGNQVYLRAQCRHTHSQRYS